MGDLCETINDEMVPKYFTGICEQYGFRMVKLDWIHTGLIKDYFAVIIGIDRFYAVVEYAIRYPNGECKYYNCDNFLTTKYDESDRLGVYAGSCASENIRGDLIIISRGLVSKWENILLGDTSWLTQLKRYSSTCEKRWCATNPLERALEREL